ncbi:MAG TPA: class I SAM-dependent methyltransferase [archaeon]|nr:class I SAM-dependent methyltransferase [archaeon]
MDSEFQKTEIELCRCGVCGIVFVHPQPGKSQLAAYYKDNYYEKPSLFFGLIRTLRGKAFSGMPPGKILDIGCGEGTFLLAMSQAGWQCYGTEVSESSQEFSGRLKEKGIRVHYGELTNAGLEPASFDLITLWHVAEHLRDPKEYILHARKLLKKNGLIFIAAPNIGSASFALWKCRWFHLDLPRHLFHFTPESASFLLENNGFEIVGITHNSFEFNPFGVLQSFYNSLGLEFNFLYKTLKNKAREKGPARYARLLLTIVSLPIAVPMSIVLAYLFSAMGRGDTMQVLARKKSESIIANH